MCESRKKINNEKSYFVIHNDVILARTIQGFQNKVVGLQKEGLIEFKVEEEKECISYIEKRKSKKKNAKRYKEKGSGIDKIRTPV